MHPASSTKKVQQNKGSIVNQTRCKQLCLVVANPEYVFRPAEDRTQGRTQQEGRHDQLPCPRNCCSLRCNSTEACCYELQGLPPRGADKVLVRVGLCKRSYKTHSMIIPCTDPEPWVSPAPRLPCLRFARFGQHWLSRCPSQRVTLRTSALPSSAGGFQVPLHGRIQGEEAEVASLVRGQVGFGSWSPSQEHRKHWEATEEAPPEGSAVASGASSSCKLQLVRLF